MCLSMPSQYTAVLICGDAICVLVLTLICSAHLSPSVSWKLGCPKAICKQRFPVPGDEEERSIYPILPMSESRLSHTWG